jgi:hypothetical protein
MSDYYEVAAMPRSGLLPTREQLFALFQDLLESSIVILPQDHSSSLFTIHQAHSHTFYGVSLTSPMVRNA